MVVDLTIENDLVRLIARKQLDDLSANGIWRSVGRTGKRLVYHAHHRRIEMCRDVLNGARQRARPAGPEIGEGLLHRGLKIEPFGVTRPREDIERQHEIWLCEMLGGTERLSINSNSLIERVGREMGCKSVRQAELRRELRPVKARSEDPYRHACSRSRHGTDGLSRVLILEVANQFENVLRKAVTAVESTAQGPGVAMSVPGARPSPRSIRSG